MTACCFLFDTIICGIGELLGSQVIQEHTVSPLEDVSPTYHDEGALRAHLAEQGIKILKPRVNFVLEKPTVLHRETIDAFRKSLNLNDPDNQLLDRFYREVEIIQMVEFKDALAACCAKVNEMIGRDYILGIAKDKSQQFVAELALPYLRHLPAQVCSVATNTTNMGITSQSPISMNYRNYLIFDDGSYSGLQLYHMLLGFCMMNTMNDLTTPRVYVVVPFVSSVALEAIEQLRHHDLVAEVRIHLITTDRRIKAVVDYFDQPEIEKLTLIFGNNTIPINCLTMAEWKFADEGSIPKQVENITFKGKKYKFVSPQPPCYKTKTE